MTLNFKNMQHVFNRRELMSKGELHYRDVLEKRQVGRTFKLVNPKHEDRLKISLKYFFYLSNRDAR